MFACLILPALVLAGSGSADAQERGKLVAVAYAPLPPDAAFVVEFREDSDLNDRLRTLFERELQAQGHAVSQDATLILTFETLIEERTGADKPLSVFGQYGSRKGSDVGLEMQLPFSKPKPEVGGRRYSLNVTVAAKNKPSLWVASAVAVTSLRDRYLVQSEMVQAVIGALGQNIDSQSLTLD